MEKKTVKYVKYSKEELKKMKGNTNWARLAHDDKYPNKKIQPTQKTRS